MEQKEVKRKTVILVTDKHGNHYPFTTIRKMCYAFSEFSYWYLRNCKLPKKYKGVIIEKLVVNDIKNLNVEKNDRRKDGEIKP